MEQVQKRVSSQDRVTREEETLPARSKGKASSAEETDALLDEIDAVLEENASDFIRDFVQKGGE